MSAITPSSRAAPVPLYIPVCAALLCVPLPLTPHARTGGFVWIYSALHYLTDGGADVRLAQYIFAGLDLALLGFVLVIYRRVPEVPVSAHAPLLSTRMHTRS